MKSAVVILNWNTSTYLREFLPALIASCEASSACVVVADNASSDDSMEVMASEFPDVRTIELDRNYGFTGGYNRAIGQILEWADAPEYVVLINSDVSVSNGWIEPLEAWMDSHPGCGACGPLLHALESDGTGGYRRTSRFEYAGAAGGYVDRFGYPYCRGRVMGLTEMDMGQYSTAHDVLWVSGACLMVRSSAWKQMGGLDPRFFAHMEEIDLCWRMGRAGWSVTVIPQSVVWHLGGGTLPQDSPWKLQLNYRNNLLMLDSNLPHTAKTRRLLLTRRVLDLASALVYLCTGRPKAAVAVLKAHAQYRKMRSPHTDADTGMSVHGHTDICVILQALIRGYRIFAYLRKYEDSH